ncbi:unnamed protein product [Ambrosiozyma monospora]|uniref:Unnamed protein product n=1 Tax=Ambrosiozyma monospora TaxID=43982 RepID=A0ACB5T7Q6_AMBMO|nr:unnamed protein product [Ambrosiozyma monospora]
MKRWYDSYRSDGSYSGFKRIRVSILNFLATASIPVIVQSLLDFNSSRHQVTSAFTKLQFTPHTDKFGINAY